MEIGLYFMGCDDILYNGNTLGKVSEKLLSVNNNTKVVVGNVECVKQGYKLRPFTWKTCFDAASSASSGYVL